MTDKPTPPTADGIYVRKITADSYEFGHLVEITLPHISGRLKSFYGNKPRGLASTFPDALVEAEKSV